MMAVLTAIMSPLLLLADYVWYVVMLVLPRMPHAGLPSGTWAAYMDGNNTVDVTLNDVLLVTLLPGAVFATAILLTRAWARFTLLRLVLAARGVLPWRLSTFLDDCRKRQLLRQSAGAYQFRHIRLQERLAERSRPRTRLSLTRPAQRRVLAGVTACALVLSVLAVHSALTPDRSRVLIMTGDIDAMEFAPPEYNTLVTVTSNDDYSKVMVRWWDSRNGEQLGEKLKPLPDDMTQDSIRLAPAENGLWLLADWIPEFIIPWNAAEQIKEASAAQGTAYDIDFHPDTRGVFYSFVRDLRTDTVKGTYRKKHEGYFPIVSADGSRVLADAGDREIAVYDVDTGKRICTKEKMGEPSDMDSKGKKLIAIHSGTTVHVVPIHGGGCGPARSLPLTVGYSEWIDDAALSWDGKWQATYHEGTDYYEGVVRLWNLSDSL